LENEALNLLHFPGRFFYLIQHCSSTTTITARPTTKSASATTFSGENGKIALFFTSDRDGYSEIYVMNARDGSKIRQD